MLLSQIKVAPLAAESLGVRSMCTYVETSDVRLLLDAGVSLCPYRFGLPPHPLEFQRINLLRRRIAEAAEKANVVTISHYHFDHHTPSYEDWLVNWTEADETARQVYAEKSVLLKNYRERINASQRQRAWMFLKTAGQHASKVEVADGKTFVYGQGTRLQFSTPVPHGAEASALGWVLMLMVECDGERFMYAPDVQGPVAKATVEQIESFKPHVLFIGGPPFYLAGFKVEETQLRVAVQNLVRLASTVPVLVVEHHALREEGWRLWLSEVFEAAEKAGNQVLTAAEFAGEPNFLLESRRKQLYMENPPSKEFKAWMAKDWAGKSHVKPPL